MAEMDISIIIPTYNREKDLKDTLRGILKQTKMPKEIIVVDDSDNDRTKELIKGIRNDFLSKRVILIYVRNKRGKSSAIARNLGAELSTGEIILFLDDDVVLDNKYIEEILKTYKKYPNAIGVQGFVKEKSLDKLRCSACARLHNSLQRAFFLFFWENNRCRILPSGEGTYPYQLSDVTNCQWLSGTNQNLKKETFLRFRFDENLKRYSLKEDMDLSYRIYKKYPTSLYITPFATLYHKESRTSRLDDETKIYMRNIYGVYFFYRNIRQTPLNKLIFIWSRIGSLIISFSGALALMKKKPRSELRKIHYLTESYIYTLKHLKEIKNGKIQFFI